MSRLVILAIETSCDDTSAAVIIDGKIVSNVIHTQLEHTSLGGVVPEYASRGHLQNIIPVVDAAIKKANINLADLNAIAYTKSPGLVGSLLVGSSFAKAMAASLSIPSIAINHIEAHVIANLIDNPSFSFPFLCLTVSGGHTQIVKCDSPLEQQILGQTIDDAAGEAFDKAAKMLGLPYPGGPYIDKYAKEGNPTAYSFAQPSIQDLNFSFSGVKTSILYFLQAQEKMNPDFIKENLHDLCASVQHTIVQILMKKLTKASKETGINNICIAGGVSANSLLRSTLASYARKYKWTYHIPAFEYCTDNAGMIAMLAYYKYMAMDFSPLTESVSAR